MHKGNISRYFNHILLKLEKSRRTIVIIILICFTLTLINYYHYSVQSHDYDIVKYQKILTKKDTQGKTIDVKSSIFYSTTFDINSSDVVVFLHIQKTGGSTFGRHLIHDLILEKQCTKNPTKRKSFDCLRPNSKDEQWLFSRFTFGWTCGLHADWTSLNECVHEKFKPTLTGKRRFLYITMLRDPISRYISEWKHVNRGATWAESYLKCHGKNYNFNLCWKGENWLGVSLEDFIACTDNIANNRQTWMLADLRLVNCTGIKLSDQERNTILIESAKKNLEDTLFFGLTEMQQQSQFLFEYALGLNFDVDFIDYNETRASSVTVSDDIIQKIKALNLLDIELYEHAKQLFKQRYEFAKKYMKIIPANE